MARASLLEVAQHLGESSVRCVIWHFRRDRARPGRQDTGVPISVPSAPARGRIMNVIARARSDEAGPISAEARRSIHQSDGRPTPSNRRKRRSSSTGIKVFDLLAPTPRRQDRPGGGAASQEF